MKLTRSKLKEIIREELMNEGPANDYSDAAKQVDKTYQAYWSAVNKFTELLHDRGLKKEGNLIHKNYMTMVKKFHSFFVKTLRSLI